MTRRFALAALLALTPALTFAQPRTVAVRDIPHTYHDRSPRIHDRSPHIHTVTRS
jgi:hypothetical protein